LTPLPFKGLMQCKQTAQLACQHILHGSLDLFSKQLGNDIQQTKSVLNLL